MVGVGQAGIEGFVVGIAPPLLASMISFPCTLAVQPAATNWEPAKSQKERCALADGYC